MCTKGSVVHSCFSNFTWEDAYAQDWIFLTKDMEFYIYGELKKIHGESRSFINPWST